MALDANVSTTWGGALATMRDTVGGMTNWSVKDTSANGGQTPMPDDEWFVLNTDLSEDIRVLTGTGDNTNGGVTFEHGPNWDATNSNWGDRYKSDIRANSNSPFDQYENYENTYAPHSQRSRSMGDTVNLWIAYADSVGFMTYVTRTEGDGADNAFVYGISKINKFWGYTTADKRESEYTQIIGSRTYNDGESANIFHSNIMSASNRYPTGNNSYTARGQVNPDGNFDNYPVLEENMVSSAQYRNSDGTDAIIGTHNLWILDRSYDQSAHKDTVQDSGGNDLYEILKTNTSAVPPLGMRYV